MRYLVFLIYLANHDDAKDELQICNSDGITLERFILYTLASLSSANPPTNFIFMHLCKLETKPFEHTCRGSYHYQVDFM
jgi:hypothetical protein